MWNHLCKSKHDPGWTLKLFFLLEFWINVKSVTNLKSFFFYNMSSSEKKFELKRFCFFFLFCFFRLFLKSVCFRKVGTWKKGFEKQKDCFIFKTQAPFFSKARGTSTPLWKIRFFGSWGDFGVFPAPGQADFEHQRHLRRWAEKIQKVWYEEKFLKIF